MRSVSWVASAEAPDTDFPISNLPYGVLADRRVVVAIGDQMLDLAAAHALGLIPNAVASLPALMSEGPRAWHLLRSSLTALLSAETNEGRRALSAADKLLVPISEAELVLPPVGDYTDFYASVHHATNVGRLFRPDNPLLPNYKHVPIGYHGRASSLVPSGTPIRRPRGQSKLPDAESPVFGPTRSLDYEAEIGFFVGPGNRLGAPIPIAEAEDHIFGFCLVNDWSARDIQSWEYQPLGPFLGKSFATTLSPWIISLEALAPFRVPASPRPADDPHPLPYLDLGSRAESIDLFVEVYLTTERMREAGHAPFRLSRGNFRDLYWTAAQMLTHHASNGCNLRPGDLLASGTISGPTPDSLGCLLEITRRGAAPISLPSGETRAFLADGDEVTMRAFCERPGYHRIGFGDCRGIILPAHQADSLTVR
ncbi:MAG TPA: fumarylacetoacetase [Gemmatimonadaceae bacterium]|nr:fumarylacetoacetase [Gemmatimonadaceae bacterium]